MSDHPETGRKGGVSDTPAGWDFPCPVDGERLTPRALGSDLEEFTAELVARSDGLLRERLYEVLEDLCWANLEAGR